MRVYRNCVKQSNDFSGIPEWTIQWRMGPDPVMSYVMSPALIFGVYEHMHDRVYFNCTHHLQQEQQLTRVCVLHCRTPLEHARDQPTPHLPHLYETCPLRTITYLCRHLWFNRGPSCALCIRVLLRTAFSELSWNIGLAHGRWTIVIHWKEIVVIFLVLSCGL